MDYNAWMGKLEATPEGGLTDEERQRIYNLNRRQIQGATNAAAGELERSLSGRGFRGGESGIADTALAGVHMAGAERLGQASTQLAMEEAKRRGDFMLGAGNLEAAWKNAQAQQTAAGAQSRAVDWSKQKFTQYEFPWEQEQAANADLWRYLQMMSGSQQEVYAPYWNAVGGA